MTYYHSISNQRKKTLLTHHALRHKSCTHLSSHKLKGDTKQYRLLAFYKPGNNRNANSRLAVKLIIKPSVNLNIFTRSNPPSHLRR